MFCTDVYFGLRHNPPYEKYQAGFIGPDKITAQEAGQCLKVGWRREGVLTIALCMEDQGWPHTVPNNPEKSPVVGQKQGPFCSPCLEQDLHGTALKEDF